MEILKFFFKKLVLILLSLNVHINFTFEGNVLYIACGVIWGL